MRLESCFSFFLSGFFLGWTGLNGSVYGVDDSLRARSWERVSGRHGEERRRYLFIGGMTLRRETVRSTRSGHRTRIVRRSWVWQGSEAQVGQRVVDGVSVRGRGRGKRECV